MKRFLLLGSLAAALLAFWVAPASAQRVDTGYLTYANGHLIDEQGQVLTEYQVMDIIGRRTYEETYNGAVQQYKAGKGLIIGGAIGTAVGIGTAIGSAIYLGPERTRNIFKDFQKEDFEDEQSRVRYKGELTLGAIGLLGGMTLASIGNLCLDAGIPLLIIGKSRLVWVAEDHNAKVYRRGNRPYIDFNTENGPGIRLNF